VPAGAVQVRPTCALPGVATSPDGAPGGAGGAGVVTVTLSKTPLPRVPSTWLVIARPTRMVSFMAMVVAVPSGDQEVPLLEKKAVKTLPARVSRRYPGSAPLPPAAEVEDPPAVVRACSR
jgi:hypothetical protein